MCNLTHTCSQVFVHVHHTDGIDSALGDTIRFVIQLTKSMECINTVTYIDGIIIGILNQTTETETDTPTQT